ERQIRRQRRALGAALLLDDLHQHDLPTFDYFLDLVLATVTRRTVRHFFHGVIAADRFNYFLLITLGGLALADGIVVVVLLGSDSDFASVVALFLASDRIAMNGRVVMLRDGRAVVEFVRLGLRAVLFGMRGGVGVRPSVYARRVVVIGR